MKNKKNVRLHFQYFNQSIEGQDEKQKKCKVTLLFFKVNFMLVCALLFASCSKKDIQPSKPKPTLFVRIVSVGADTIYSNIIKVK